MTILTFNNTTIIQFQIMGWVGGLIKRMGGTDNQNINKSEAPNIEKWRGFENCCHLKVATGYHYLWGLLRLNLGVQGEYLTSQPSWAAA